MQVIKVLQGFNIRVSSRTQNVIDNKRNNSWSKIMRFYYNAKSTSTPNFPVIRYVILY